MSEIKVYYEQCEDCYGKVSMMEMIVKETPDGNCIYCPKCVERHKFLDEESKRLCKQWGIDTVAFAKQVDKEEKRLLKEKKEKK
jgi:hypothetical protein